MHLLLLTVLTMIAFAGNSVLNRLALAGAAIDPASFALIRTIAGAAMLSVLVVLRGNGANLRSRPDHWAVLSLVIYMIGFSYAYVTLDAGIGALILFGVVQVTMFAGAIVRGNRVPKTRWLGAGVAFAGLVYLLWPSGGGGAPSLFGAALMIPAAVGWGVYSLRGQMAADPLTATALNFNYAVAFVAVVFVIAAGQYITAGGAILAILSGAVTSGLGYALWYGILPRLEATVAAVAQLTVPIIAMAGGMVFLAEAPDQRFWIAAILVVSGVLISLIKRDAHK